MAARTETEHICVVTVRSVWVIWRLVVNMEVGG
jgi:hypothetical protein